MSGNQYLPRPTLTDDLVERLAKLDSGLESVETAKAQGKPAENKSAPPGTSRDSRKEHEGNAIRALSQSMIDTFVGDPKIPYALEVTALSPYTSVESYKALFGAFVNVVADGTSDSKLLDAELLAAFNNVLHCAQAERVGSELPLGYAVLSLTKRLTTAFHTASPATQYQLVRALSAVLDAMNEVKIKGISDVEMVQPLLGMLEGAGKHSELRLCLAARYAYQALLGVPSDVSPWKKLREHAFKTLQGAAKVAGSVYTLDPSKLLDGVEALAALPDLVKCIVNLIGPLSQLTDDAWSTYRAAKGVRPPARWYLSLRYTDALIRGRNPELLKALLRSPEFPCREDKEFLCGLCAQYEQATRTGGLAADDKVVLVLKEFLAANGGASKSERVREWLRLVNITNGNAAPAKPSKSGGLFSKLGFGGRTYGTTLGYPPPPPETARGDLLAKAWESCHKAQLFYADQVIRDRYTSPSLELLKIDRLSGVGLSMDQCYINLAIQQDGPKGGGPGSEKPAPPSFSLQRRLAIWEPAGSNRISLPTLFEKKKSEANNFMLNPFGGPSAKEPASYTRVLIRGQAGVGKSTLCKKAVYDYINDGMWSDIIDRIIWVPLRQLKGPEKSKYTIQRLLQDDYFAGVPEGQLLTNALCAAIESDKARTLFILDGLDEVAREVASKESELLMTLLDQPRVIITTRPYGIDWERIKNIDRKLETIGFYPAQVKEYVRSVAPNNAHEIQAFLESHPVIEGLARIPIQLDALCYSLEAKSFYAEDPPKTMTALYQAIEQAIWDKDVSHLEKVHQGSTGPISQIDAQRANPDDIRSLVQGEVNLLQGLAFAGLNANVIEFDPRYLKKFLKDKVEITKFLPTPMYQAWSSDLEKLSFLRTSDGKSIRNGSYHFLHLTFQEFFAAQYFVEHWPDKPLPRLGLTAKDFLRKEKYNPRFDILWRFVTGLLEADGEADDFFETIEEKPHDLLGPVHQRLIMHCVNELDAAEDAADAGKLRANLESQLESWAVLECNLLETSCLVAEMEFPENILIEILQNEPEDTQVKLLRSLHGKAKVLPTMLEHVASCLRDGISIPFKSWILYFFERLGEPLPEHILQQVAGLLEETRSREMAASTLCVQHGISPLPDAILQDVAALLRDPSSELRTSVISSLCKQARALPEKILQEIAVLMNDPDTRVKECAATSLADNAADLPENILQQVAALLTSPDAGLRYNVITTLSNRADALPGRILDQIAALLKHPDPAIRFETAKCFGPEAHLLPSSIVQQMGSLLMDPARREPGAQPLSLSVLPDETLKQLVALLKAPEAKDRAFAANILCEARAAGPSEAILKEVAALLKDPVPDVRSSTASALESQAEATPLPDSIVRDIAGLLKDPSPSIAAAAARALGEQGKKAALPPDVLRSMEAALKRPEQGIRLDTTEALGFVQAMVALPESLLREVAVMLKDPDSDARVYAARAVGAQASPRGLPEPILQDLVALLQDPVMYVRSAAEEAVGQQLEVTSPAEKILSKVSVQLKHSDILFRVSAAEILARLPPAQASALPEETIVDMFALLKEPAEHIRNRTLEALGRLAALREERFHTFLAGMDGPAFNELYGAWLKRSFQEQLAWVAEGQSPSAGGSNGDHSAALEQVKKAVCEARVHWKVPSPDLD